MAGRVGQHIDRYCLTCLIGQGEFGEVYLGEHLHNSSQVAIKVLDTQLTNGDMENFLTKGRIIHHLKHKNLVQVLYFDEVDGFPFLIMDYFPNGSLRQRHPGGTCLLPETFVPYVRQVADALHYAHDQKLIHSDVKPENMLLGGNNKVLLSDFDLALIPRSSRLIGTYMAPEQIKGNPCPASDQYALGIIVYEWISGTPPFKGSYMEIISQHLSFPPPPLRTKVPTLPSDIEQVVLIALKKDPKERFASVKAFANALEQACNSGPYIPPARASFYMLPPNPLPVPSTPTPSQSQSWLERNLSRRGMVVLLATAIAAGAGALAWEYVSNAHGLTTTPIPIPGHSATVPPLLPGTTWLVYTGHKGEVKAVAWSPDGKRIASGSSDRTVQVWDAAAGQTLFTYRGHTDEVKAVAWSPHDGKYIASGSTDMTVQVWETTRGKLITAYHGHSAGVRTVAWSPDGKLIASGAGQDNTHHDDTVQVWNASTRDHIFTYRRHKNQVTTIAWLPDGPSSSPGRSSRIASASFDKNVRVWNATNGQDVLFPLAHSAGVRGVAWSPDGKFIASGGNDNKVYVWDAKTGQLLRSYPGHTGSVQSVAWSPDRNYIASGSFDHTVKVWKVTTGQNVYTYHQHMDQVWSVEWSPNGQYIASGSIDGTVRVWQAR